jgi:hypothetical protein
MIILLVGLPLMIIFAAIGITVSIVEHGRNYVVFDTKGIDHHVRVDGTDLGSAKKPRALRVEAGPHKLEVIDAKGQTVAQTTTNVPAAGWRGVFSIVPSTRYAIVKVVYDSTSKPEIRMLEQQGGGLHAMNDGNVGTLELERLGDPFPITAKRNESSTRLCRIDGNGHAECLR